MLPARRACHDRPPHRPLPLVRRPGRAAAAFYAQTFPGGRVSGTSRYPETFDNPGGPRQRAHGRVRGRGPAVHRAQWRPDVHHQPQHLVLRLRRHAGRRRPGSSPRSPTAARCSCRSTPTPGASATAGCRTALACRGRSSRADAPGGAIIVPCLMFAGAAGGPRGRGDADLRRRVFRTGEVEDIARYGPGEGPEASVKHGRFLLAGQDMIAMDSHSHTASGSTRRSPCR